MSWYSIVRRGGTTSTPWDPSLVGSLESWYKADAITGIADGGSVQTWEDSGPGGHDPTRSTVSQQPVFIENGLNSLPVLRANGDDLMIAPTTIAGGDDGLTVFTVAKRTSGNVATRNGGFLIGADGNKFRLRLIGTTTYEVVSAAGVEWSATGFDIVGFDADGSAGTMIATANGSSIGSLTGQAASTTVSYAVQLFDFGGARLNGDLAEVIIITASVGQSVREKIEGYLAHKWGLTANLPVAHPYKTTAPTA